MPPNKRQCLAVAAQATEHPVHAVDDDGDLRLAVGEDELEETFIVCSRTLARASKPFTAMLYGVFAESNHCDPLWTVELPQDSPKAFSTLLNIIHGHYSKVPTVVTRDELYQITVLTNKYEMTGALRPWAQAWIEPQIPGHYVYNQDEGDEVWLWTAWELGHFELLLAVQTNFFVTFSLAEDGALLSTVDAPLDHNIYVNNVADWVLYLTPPSSKNLNADRSCLEILSSNCTST